MPVDMDVYSTPDVDPAFVLLASSWAQHPARQFLGFIWLAYDNMVATPPNVNSKDLERNISQFLEPRVRDVMTGYEPFYIQHGPFERETMKAPPAQPPEYDLAFILRADERIMWPLEAKVLETSGSVASYINDVQNQFLTCRYAPFSNSGAMLGYLLSGKSADVFDAISSKLSCNLDNVGEHPLRPNRLSSHQRQVPSGKPYPSEFQCYHLMLDFPTLSRG